MSNPKAGQHSGAWKPGQSGNPGGLTAAHRASRRAVREALEKRFTEAGDGTDELIDAIVAGVRAREPQIIKLACEYRWGKPVQQVDIGGGGEGDEPVGIVVQFVKPDAPQG